jgi:hypothetical protein
VRERDIELFSTHLVVEAIELHWAAVDGTEVEGNNWLVVRGGKCAKERTHKELHRGHISCQKKLVVAVEVRRLIEKKQKLSENCFFTRRKKTARTQAVWCLGPVPCLRLL